MKKNLALVAALCLSVIIASGTANASSYYSTNTISQTVTNTVYRSWQSFVFDQYNVADPIKGGLMDLLSVTVSLDYSYLTGSASVQNVGTDPTSITSYSTTFLVGATTNALGTNALGYSFYSNSIASVATTPDWSTMTINGGQTENLSLDGGQYFVNPSTPNVQSIANNFFSAYTGAGTIAFLLRNPMLIGTDGDHYLANTSGAGALTSMTVTYTYGVPEPSTYALFGLGAVALVIAARRKRTA